MSNSSSSQQNSGSGNSLNVNARAFAPPSSLSNSIGATVSAAATAAGGAAAPGGVSKMKPSSTQSFCMYQFPRQQASSYAPFSSFLDYAAPAPMTTPQELQQQTGEYCRALEETWVVTSAEASPEGLVPPDKAVSNQPTGFIVTVSADDWLAEPQSEEHLAQQYRHFSAIMNDTTGVILASSRHSSNKRQRSAMENEAEPRTLLHDWLALLPSLAQFPLNFSCFGCFVLRGEPYIFAVFAPQAVNTTNTSNNSSSLSSSLCPAARNLPPVDPAHFFNSHTSRGGSIVFVPGGFSSVNHHHHHHHDTNSNGKTTTTTTTTPTMTGMIMSHVLGRSIFRPAACAIVLKNEGDSSPSSSSSYASSLREENVLYTALRTTEIPSSETTLGTAAAGPTFIRRLCVTATTDGAAHKLLWRFSAAHELAEKQKKAVVAASLDTTTNNTNNNNNRDAMVVPPSSFIMQLAADVVDTQSLELVANNSELPLQLAYARSVLLIEVVVPFIALLHATPSGSATATSPPPTTASCTQVVQESMKHLMSVLHRSGCFPSVVFDLRQHSRFPVFEVYQQQHQVGIKSSTLNVFVGTLPLATAGARQMWLASIDATAEDGNIIPNPAMTKQLAVTHIPPMSLPSIIKIPMTSTNNNNNNNGGAGGDNIVEQQNGGLKITNGNTNISRKMNNGNGDAAAGETTVMVTHQRVDDLPAMESLTDYAIIWSALSTCALRRTTSQYRNQPPPPPQQQQHNDPIQETQLHLPDVVAPLVHFPPHNVKRIAASTFVECVSAFGQNATRYAARRHAVGPTTYLIALSGRFYLADAAFRVVAPLPMIADWWGGVVNNHTSNAETSINHSARRLAPKGMCVLECTLAATMYPGLLKLVAHDVLVWDGRSVGHTHPFVDRSALMQPFVDEEEGNAVPSMHGIVLVRSKIVALSDAVPLLLLSPDIGCVGAVDYEHRGVVIVHADARPTPCEQHPFAQPQPSAAVQYVWTPPESAVAVFAVSDIVAPSITDAIPSSISSHHRVPLFTAPSHVSEPAIAATATRSFHGDCAHFHPADLLPSRLMPQQNDLVLALFQRSSSHQQQQQASSSCWHVLKVLKHADLVEMFHSTFSLQAATLRHGQIVPSCPSPSISHRDGEHGGGGEKSGPLLSLLSSMALTPRAEVDAVVSDPFVSVKELAFALEAASYVCQRCGAVDDAGRNVAIHQQHQQQQQQQQQQHAMFMCVPCINQSNNSGTCCACLRDGCAGEFDEERRFFCGRCWLQFRRPPAVEPAAAKWHMWVPALVSKGLPPRVSDFSRDDVLSMMMPGQHQQQLPATPGGITGNINNNNNNMSSAEMTAAAENSVFAKHSDVEVFLTCQKLIKSKQCFDIGTLVPASSALVVCEMCCGPESLGTAEFWSSVALRSHLRKSERKTASSSSAVVGAPLWPTSGGAAEDENENAADESSFLHQQQQQQRHGSDSHSYFRIEGSSSDDDDDGAGENSKPEEDNTTRERKKKREQVLSTSASDVDGKKSDVDAVDKMRLLYIALDSSPVVTHNIAKHVADAFNGAASEGACGCGEFASCSNRNNSGSRRHETICAQPATEAFWRTQVLPTLHSNVSAVLSGSPFALQGALLQLCGGGAGAEVNCWSTRKMQNLVQLLSSISEALCPNGVFCASLMDPLFVQSSSGRSSEQKKRDNNAAGDDNAEQAESGRDDEDDEEEDEEHAEEEEEEEEADEAATDSNNNNNTSAAPIASTSSPSRLLLDGSIRWYPMGERSTAAFEIDASSSIAELVRQTAIASNTAMLSNQQKQLQQQQQHQDNAGASASSSSMSSPAKDGDNHNHNNNVNTNTPQQQQQQLTKAQIEHLNNSGEEAKMQQQQQQLEKQIVQAVPMRLLHISQSEIVEAARLAGLDLVGNAACAMDVVKSAVGNNLIASSSSSSSASYSSHSASSSSSGRPSLLFPSFSLSVEARALLEATVQYTFRRRVPAHLLPRKEKPLVTPLQQVPVTPAAAAAGGVGATATSSGSTLPSGTAPAWRGRHNFTASAAGHSAATDTLSSSSAQPAATSHRDRNRRASGGGGGGGGAGAQIAAQKEGAIPSAARRNERRGERRGGEGGHDSSNGRGAGGSKGRNAANNSGAASASSKPMMGAPPMVVRQPAPAAAAPSASASAAGTYVPPSKRNSAK